MRSFRLTLLALVAVAGTAFAVDADLRKLAEDADSFKRSDAARALAKDGTPAAAKILCKLLADDNPYVRDHTVNACDKISDEAAVGVLAAAAKGRDELLRANVAAALGKTKSPAALETLSRLARKDKSPRVRIAALDALWGFRGNEDAVAISAEAAEDRDESVRAAAVEAAGRIRGDAAVAVVHKALGDADEGVRAVARMELRFVDKPRAAEDLAASIADEGWRTRAQLVENAYWLMDGPSLDALVVLVGDARLRVAAAAHRALVEITGKQLGRDADIWKAWWDANREAWETPKKRAGGDVPSEDGGTRAVYHGMEILSGQVVFVVDASGSMKDELAGAGGKTRWESAREELERAVDALADGTRVNVVVFQEQAKAAFERPQEIGKKSRKAIASFLKRVSPGERGNLLEGLLLAIGQDDVDTVYLLSDGAPSCGDHTVKNRVGDAVRSVNRTRKVAINTIGFGATKGTERSFLQRLSRDSMGQSKTE